MKTPSTVYDKIAGFIPVNNSLLTKEENNTTLSLLKLLLQRTKRRFYEVKAGYRIMWDRCQPQHVGKYLIIYSISLDELLLLGRKFQRDVVIHSNGKTITSYTSRDGKPELQMTKEEAQWGWLTAMSMPGSICFPAAG